MNPACGGGRRGREERGESLEEGKGGRTSRFGVQVKEEGQRDEEKRKRVGQEEMQGGGARDVGRRGQNTCRLFVRRGGSEARSPMGYKLGKEGHGLQEFQD